TTTGKPTSGNVYVAFGDGGLGIGADEPVFGFYSYADAFVARSTDGGVTFDVPRKVNSNLEPALPPLPGEKHGTDQFSPAIAVDKTGAVGVCWYDRRNDPANFKIDRYCARSV